IGQGQGTGLTARTLGQTGGTEAVTVVEAGMPVHTHTFNASSGPTTTNNPNGTMHAALPAGEVQFLTAAHTATTTSTFVLAPNTVLPVGSSLGHNNVMPSLPLNYIIATTGIYPQPA
ncbi:MAG: phage tail protein, partial [Magnetospirillum sp.]|nr:phage tail protein [Magnetospirillum sp.]